MTTATIRLPAPGRSATADTGSLVELIQLWRSRARQRRQLSQLSPAQLDDIGIDPAAAWAEAAKPFWRA